ncbi:integrase family protein [Coriobacterium glomerans PW2]|uniref:Tyrosine recombinase XerC n=1 Tax=Coriobacterium glomerans (strain ATCC 49209 / DSM 20642 / JCM 10262 / PW2) TaxID=700015 RepID=F2N9G7_CORGP|nr:tyrosine recombinase XerC [Coriobacterium glomerans]AEB06996.1 integrase family protein [Coriobacterium glomerans PW2]
MSPESVIEGFIDFLLQVDGCSPETARAYEGHLRAYLSWQRRAHLDGLVLEVPVVRSYLADLYDARRSPRTIAAHLSAIRSLSRWLLLEGITKTDAVATMQTPRIPTGLPRTLTQQQMEQLLALPDTASPTGSRDAAILELLYASGARISEIAALDIASLDAEQRCVRLLGKGSKERIVPLYRRALRRLVSYLDEGRPLLIRSRTLASDSDRTALFLSRRGRRMSADSLRCRFRAYARIAGLPADITPHAMRHTFATDLLAGGADMRSVQELLGHASLATTQLYTHLTPERMKDALRRAHPRSGM